VPVGSVYFYFYYLSMSVTTRALYPSDATVLGWGTIEDIRGWAGVSVEEWKDVATALGDETLDNVILVAGMPPHLLTSTLRTWIAEKGATPLRQFRMAMLLNAARLKVNMELVDLLPSPDAPAVSTAGSSQAAPAIALPLQSGSMVKVKLSQVIDQGSDQEVGLLDAVKLNEYRWR